VLGVFVAIAVAGSILVAANGGSLGEQIPYIVAFTMFGAVGALILSRDRRNTIGRLLLYGSLTTAASFAGGELATWLARRGTTGLPAQVCGLISGFGWLLGILPVLFFLPLLFPDGRLPSPRWRPFFWFIVGSIGVFFLLLTFASPTVSTSSDEIVLDNPLYVEAFGSIDFDPVFGVLYIGIFGTSVASLFVRFRRAGGIERQQIKWVAFGFLAAFLAITLSDILLTSTPALSAIIGGVGFLVLPVTIGVAVLRFRLYDLDVVLRKTVVYTALALFATVVYLALVVGLGAWLGRGDSFLTMVAAVVVAVTFQPVRSRFTRVANRIVYGRRATPYEVLAEFSERVGDAYADEDVLPRMARVLGEGVGADRADVWLAIDGELRDVAVWPAGAVHLDPIAIENGSLPVITGADRVYAVTQGGELLGALAVSKPASDPVSPSDEKLIADLAAQAGLVLRNVRLTEDLKARLAELKAAQKRIVQAQDHERRRLERNIHDGAQQQLVALSVKLKLADDLIERDPGKARELIEQIRGETQTTLEDLRDLARGIYPPLLADRGLAAALESQARKVGFPVEVRDGGVGRSDQEVEAAVYFSCLEALQNVGKYADASGATITLTRTDGVLGFAVADDGRGFDPTAETTGTGLRGIADRLAALDGALQIRSAPGEGTTIVGRLPAPAPVEART
jgi:signal transduction histidine kinase